MMARRIFLMALACLCMTACGYQWQGLHTPAATSVLGDGSRTLKMGEVDQPTLYPWMPAFFRSVTRDEVNLRKLARWVDGGEADYTLSIVMPSSRHRAAFSDSEGRTMLTSVGVSLELFVYDGKTGNLVWRSGMVHYAEQYESVMEEESIRLAVTQALYRAMDKMQQAF